MVSVKCIQNYSFFVAGHQYVMCESNEDQLRNQAPTAFGMSTKVSCSYVGQNLDDKSILICRTSGIGDILIMLNAIQELKKKYPTCKISVASGQTDILKGEADKLYFMPFDAEIIKQHDYFLHFQGILESNDFPSMTTHASDLFLQRLFLDSDKKIATLKSSKLELNWLEATLEEMKLKNEDISNDSDFVIGVQMMPSNIVRGYPTERMKRVINKLASENVVICLIGENNIANFTLADYYKGNKENIKICTGFNLRQTIVFSQRYDLIISPDSMMIQLAGCYKIPCVGIYGPFPSDLRMRYHYNSIGIDACVVCSPCFSYDEKCLKGNGWSPCFNSIKPTHILSAADKLYYSITNKHFNYMKDIKTPEVVNVICD